MLPIETNPFYQGITFSISGMLPGQKVSIPVSSATRICFTTGQPFRTTSGLIIRTQGGGASFAQIELQSDRLTITTSSAGSTADFPVLLSLAAHPDIRNFYLSAESDNGINISAALPMRDPVQLNADKTTFRWQP